MTDEQLLRYARQILLPGFGYEGQQRLLDARVLVVGLGGLGSPVAMYLAAAGLGRLVLADADVVDLSNLQRQILHTTDRVGLAKVDSARRTLAALNPDVRIEGVEERLSAANLPALLDGVDLVVDGSDNFATRFAVNAACFAAGVPLVSGAAIRGEGQVAVFSGRRGGPCYDCLYPRDGREEETCAANGVLAPLVGIIGSIQASEALKVLTGLGEPLFGRLLLVDALTMDCRRLTLSPDPHCPVCAARG
ncbi:dinucleotide-utilizing enzyme possibly involved in molybdopterin or thiamin biosynthesis [Thioflavicoccus mobilis 8321]|uniref:Molybdopterin-synthase adenylyltransferase n=1 Tax=Thioflavicoccus mobilis 8321 TaxID=765912 RepID=L0H2D2_9GAMM|nr:molybdopterin-synthase adenylyltransferase MoeB [Thioflavicoccus mobilis]AGA91810.1 dinucleotide-utilizing enzyme possibly involved in molybdopterin or thiamin biosynthesis [Thioflavicoccus mobilis 8321]